MTSYDKVTDRFFNKITDFNLENIDINDANEITDEFLRSAIAEFMHCYIDLDDRDDGYRMFNKELLNSEIEILSSYMVIQWLNQKINHEQFLKRDLGSKDYPSHSPANLLNSLMMRQRDTKANINDLTTRYYYFEQMKERER